VKRRRRTPQQAGGVFESNGGGAPRSKLVGHARRRRIKPESSQLISSYVGYGCPLSPMQASGYYDKNKIK